MMLTGVFAAVTGSNKAQQQAAAAAAAKSPEQRASEESAKKADVARYTAAQLVTETLKKAAREPESVKFDSVRVSQDAKLVCVEWRGRNGFGGMGAEHVLVLDGKFDKSVGAWNKRCAGPLFDYTSYVGS